MEKEISKPNTNDLVKELVALVKKGHAHVSLHDALKDVPFEDLGKRPDGLPYSTWEIVEHIRIAQWDILDFCRNKDYKELEWPADYWPKETSPANEDAWKNCIEQVNNDLSTFINLLQDPRSDLFEPFAHGTGQTLLREAMLIADHNSYHTGQIVLIRRLLGNWK